MNDRIRNSQAAYLRRSSTWLAGGFATLALLLGAVGLYGVIAYSVGHRTREFGVRIALGAQRATIYRLILQQAAWLTVIGIVAGLSGSVIAAALLRNLLFGVEPYDVAVMTSVAGALAVSALLASYIPARRAASLSPMDALRRE
jgi:ABC-type antimicrobial peptide transport system permease subunit